MSWCWGNGTSAICWRTTPPTTMGCARTLHSTRIRRSIDPCRQSGVSHQSLGSAVSIALCSDGIIGRHRHKARYAPLHLEIVKRLIPYMERVRAEHGDGPLFRHLPKDENGKRSTYVARKIDEWMDGVIKDPNLAPNHSFQHYLKSELLARDVPERISDAITGHKTPGIGRKYEHVPMSDKFDAIDKLPVIPLQAAYQKETVRGIASSQRRSFSDWKRKSNRTFLR